MIYLIINFKLIENENGYKIKIVILYIYPIKYKK